MRAADTCGYIGQALETFNIDTNIPTLTPDLPPYLTGSCATFGGTVFDSEGEVAQVEVQMDDEAATWHLGQLYAPDLSGTQTTPGVCRQRTVWRIQCGRAPPTVPAT